MKDPVTNSHADNKGEKKQGQEGFFLHIICCPCEFVIKINNVHPIFVLYSCTIQFRKLVLNLNLDV